MDETDCPDQTREPFGIKDEGCAKKLTRVVDNCNTDTNKMKFGGWVMDKVSL